ncbi:HNH endonuclease [Vibrio splendidus]|uniref:HNH endonuclease n=1 Tax=Vibrio splendidus TaxID=29497 RepID=UPI000D3B8533|nr:HNH endonuclease [Vibrio splendidus]PTP72579.1 HNH endonuclease [Vibrio splendidus]
MKHLDDFNDDNLELWLTLALSSQKANVSTLEEIKDSVIDAYTEYQNIISNHSDKPSATNFEEHSDLLVDFYNAPPKNLSKLIKHRRNEHGLLECPFCGYPTSPDTLDHFIPKDDWPEYSIFANNLVPQCRGCAPTKGKKYYCDENNQAIFIHPIYSDILSKINFRHYIDFNTDSNKIVFRITITLPRNILEDQETLRKINLHFDMLNIKTRAVYFSHRKIRHWKNLLKQNNFDLRLALTTRLNEKSEAQHYKDWESSLYKSMLENDSLIDYLQSIGEQVEPSELTTDDRFELEI